MRALPFIVALGSVIGGCNCGSSAPTGTPTRAPGKSAKVEAAGPPLASKDFYRLDLAGEPTCQAATPCDVRIMLTALAGHHVNREYPTKFVAVASTSVPVEGIGTFEVEDETHGVMTIRVTPAKAGTFTLDGQFRLSVCTDDTCEIESPKIALPIRAS